MARKKYACDFETTTDINDCRVWGFGCKNIFENSAVKIGKDIDEFMSWAIKSNSDLYFHNLKFDGSFIINWLMKNGYEYGTENKPNTFNVLISNMGQWYMIDIINGYKGKRKLHVAIYDSLKKLPFTIKKIAEAFNLPVKKGEIDYHKKREVGYEITEEEKEYIENDVEILAQALKIQFEEGQTKMTNGADALSDYKEILNKKVFDKHFPVLSFEIDENIRKAYRGGFTWLKDDYKEKVVNGGIVLDINSMYPFIMSDRLLPYGYPMFFEGEYESDDNYPLYIQHIRCEFDLKDGKIPSIQIKDNPFFKSNEYLKSSKGEYVDLYMTNVDLELMFEHYHVHEIEYLSGWKFRGIRGLFEDYIDKWIKVKSENKGAIRLLAKLMLNSLYGKFASNPEIKGKKPYLKEDGSNGFTEAETEIRDSVYTAMGIFITSYGRDMIIRTSQECYSDIIYCDTDSMHLATDKVPEQIKDRIDPNKLGYWDFEGYYERGKYLRQKTYMHEFKNDDGSIRRKITCSGLPDSVKDSITIENFKPGLTVSGNLKPKQVNGGVVLIDTNFTIKGVK